MQARSNSFAASQPLRLLTAALVLALAGAVTQTAFAAPDGYPGGGRHAGMHDGAHGGTGMMGMGGAGMGMAHPRQMARWLDGVDATPEQRAQIRQLLDAARTDMQAQRDSGRQLHEQMRSLFTQPNVDAGAAEALRQQMLARQDQASQRRMQLMLDLSRVLTPEQRQALAENQQQRRTLMERHRAERRALEPKR